MAVSILPIEISSSMSAAINGAMAYAVSAVIRRIVVVERDAEGDQIQRARERGALVLIGDAQDPELLRRAGVAKAPHEEAPYKKKAWL